MSTIEISGQQHLPLDDFVLGAPIPDANSETNTDLHTTTPYWSRQFTDDSASACSAWMEQVGSLPIDDSVLDLDSVAIYQQAFTQKRASLSGWKLWRRRNTGEPDREIMGELTNSAASLGILRNAVAIDETAVTE